MTEELPFCVMCAGHHVGKCPPENFVYFKCKECGKVIYMPWDAAAMVVDNDRMTCSCDAEASFEQIEQPSEE